MDQRDDWHLTDNIAHERGAGDPFAAAVRATRMPMVITDPAQDDNPIVFCNKAFQDLTGYAREEIIGRNCRFLQGAETDRKSVDAIHDAIAAGHDVAVDLLNYRKDGTTFWNALYLSPVRNAAGEIQFFFASQLDVTDRVEAQQRIAEQKAEVEREVERRTAALKAALEEKTLLLHEVDHRVKNNLTMIGSLLRLQNRGLDDPRLVQHLDAMLQRIDALASVHRGLYQAEDVHHFDAAAFVRALVSDILATSGRRISAEVDVASMTIPTRDAAAFGMLMNELVMNAVKHGAQASGGAISLSARVTDGRAEIRVRDSGPGLPQAFHDRPGFGARLVRRLARQVGATVDWMDDSPGAVVIVRLPVERA